MLKTTNKNCFFFWIRIRKATMQVLNTMQLIEKNNIQFLLEQIFLFLQSFLIYWIKNFLKLVLIICRFFNFELMFNLQPYTHRLLTQTHLLSYLLTLTPPLFIRMEYLFLKFFLDWQIDGCLNVTKFNFPFVFKLRYWNF